jgi:predicted phosphodiesterase
MAGKSKGKAAKGSNRKVMRFAHPFYTNTPAADRKPVAGAGQKMTDYVQAKLLAIPKPIRNPPQMTLADIVGAQGEAAITTAKKITFHAFGDSGNTATDIQELIAGVMARDFTPATPDTSPAFLLHLGDVIYYDNTDTGYQSQFYVPYKKYPGKIIAIPGNHDGELFKYDGTPTGQKVTLGAFQQNFCQPKSGVPKAAGTIYREMVSQPGVYWWLNAPFLDVVALYSNVGEGPGYISGPIPGQAQKKWLTATLAQIKKNRAGAKRKALLIVMHHPPYSHGGHDSSTDMLKDIDDSCTTAGIMPDVVLAGHSHTYQRFTRYKTFGGVNMQIPYYVVGTGGRKPSGVSAANGARVGDYSYDAAASSYGFLTVTCTETEVDLSFTEVKEDGSSNPFDKKVVVDLKTNTIR